MADRAARHGYARSGPPELTRGSTAEVGRAPALTYDPPKAADDFRARVALVTGGSGGIGAALCERLAERGAAIAVHYSGSRDSAEQLADRISGRGGRAAAVHADLREPDAPDSLVDRVEAQLGAIDILAANAGLGRRASYEEIDADAFDETVAVNLRAPYLLARRVLSGMRERKFGRILFTSSIAAFTGGIVGPDYAASKAGLHGLTHHLATRVAREGVTVNAIAPALIAQTGMLPGDPGDLAERIPVGRLGSPDEVAALALALLSNAYVTNQVVSIDGGMYPR